MCCRKSTAGSTPTRGSPIILQTTWSGLFRWLIYGVRRLAFCWRSRRGTVLFAHEVGSRSIWIYLAALVVLGVVLYRLRPQAAALRILGFGIACVYGFLAMQWLAEFLLAGAALPFETIQARMGTEGLQSGFRMRMWHEAWLMFLDAPLIGAGFRQFAWQHFLLNAQLTGPRIVDSITDHAHNLVLQTMAEFGIAGIAVLSAGLSFLLFAIRRREPSPHLWWLCAVLAIWASTVCRVPAWYAISRMRGFAQRVR